MACLICEDAPRQIQFPDRALREMETGNIFSEDIPVQFEDGYAYVVGVTVGEQENYFICVNTDELAYFRRPSSVAPKRYARIPRKYVAGYEESGWIEEQEPATPP